jgi:valyl-tRNA synthetase
VWSWWQQGSIHRSSWPTPDEVVDAIGGEDAGAAHVFTHTQMALADVRRIKALEKKPVKAVIERAVLPERYKPIAPAERDFKAAAHIREVSFADVAEVSLQFAQEQSA